jgi:hypothetical protein
MPLPCALHVALQDAWSILKEELSREAMETMMPGPVPLSEPGQSLTQSGQECPKCAQLQAKLSELYAAIDRLSSQGDKTLGGGQM